MWWSAEGTQPADKGIKKASSKRANTLVKNHFDDVRPLQGRLCLFHVDRRFLHCVQSLRLCTFAVVGDGKRQCLLLHNLLTRQLVHLYEVNAATQL